MSMLSFSKTLILRFRYPCLPKYPPIATPTQTANFSHYFIQAEPKTSKRLDAAALRADRSEIPIPYLRVGKRYAEVEAPVMFDERAEARYGCIDGHNDHLKLENHKRERNTIVAERRKSCINYRSARNFGKDYLRTDRLFEILNSCFRTICSSQSANSIQVGFDC